MAGTRQRGWVVTSIWIAVWLAGSIAATSALAQPVPLPPPAPLAKEGTKEAPRTGTVPIPPAGVPTPRATAPTPSGPTSWLNQLLGVKPEPPPADTNFDPKQRALVARVSAYLSSVQVLTGDFIQIGPDGRRAQGEFYIQKPGKVRFEYAPPSQIDIVAD